MLRALLINSVLGGFLHPAAISPAFRFVTLCFGLLLCNLAFNAKVSADDTGAGMTTATTTNPQVRLHTNRGDIVIELWPDKSPATVANFLQYVDAGFYTGTIFHRVIKDNLIQGGGYNKFMQMKPTRDPIVNEAKNRLKHERGTIAMARQLKPNSATSQFFINVRLNSQLNFRFGQSGYAVFGRIVQGMDIVDAISQQPTGTLGAFSDVPLDLIIIETATRVTPVAQGIVSP